MVGNLNQDGGPSLEVIVVGDDSPDGNASPVQSGPTGWRGAVCQPMGA